MQWLIDLVIAAIGIPPTYIDRGNYDIPDVRQIGDFIVNGWHELDLSDVIGPGATAVAIRLKGKSNTIEHTIRLRPHGTTSTWYTCVLSAQIANVWFNTNVVIGVDADGKIDYNIMPGFTNIEFIVRGWWK